MLDEVRQQATPALQELRRVAAEMANPDSDFRKSVTALREMVEELPAATRELRQLARDTDRAVNMAARGRRAGGARAAASLAKARRHARFAECDLEPGARGAWSGARAHARLRRARARHAGAHQAARRTWLLRDYIEPSQMRTLPVDSFESWQAMRLLVLLFIVSATGCSAPPKPSTAARQEAALEANRKGEAHAPWRARERRAQLSGSAPLFASPRGCRGHRGQRDQSLHRAPATGRFADARASLAAVLDQRNLQVQQCKAGRVSLRQALDLDEKNLAGADDWMAKATGTAPSAARPAPPSTMCAHSSPSRRAAPTPRSSLRAARTTRAELRAIRRSRPTPCACSASWA